MVCKQCKKIKNDTYYQIASEEVNQLVLEHKLRKEDETLEKFWVFYTRNRLEIFNFILYNIFEKDVTMMKLYDNIGSLRLMNIKVIKDNKDTLYEGMIENAPDDIKKLRYAKIEIDSGTTILHVFSQENLNDN